GMSMDDASLSEHEQRILDEIERNLVAEDSDFVRRVRAAAPQRDARVLRLGLLGLIVGLCMLLAFVWRLDVAIAGFFLMLVSAVGVGVSVRNLSGPGRAPSSVVKDALKRAEARLRDRRSKS